MTNRAGTTINPPPIPSNPLEVPAKAPNNNTMQFQKSNRQKNSISPITHKFINVKTRSEDLPCLTMIYGQQHACPCPTKTRALPKPVPMPYKNPCPCPCACPCPKNNYPHITQKQNILDPTLYFKIVM